MKNSTKQLLESELQSGMYRFNVGIRPIKSISQLFEMYLEEEMDSVDQLLETYRSRNLRESDFYKFVIEHFEDFQIDSSVLKTYCTSNAMSILSNELSNAMYRRTKYLGMFLMKDKKDFVKLTNKIVRPGHLLDVGSGTEMPVSSLLFARDRGCIASMDKFKTNWTDLGFLKKMGIDAKSEYFSDETDCSSYDVIVGQSPCSAISHIVNKCANSDEKEYFIRMCDCASPRNGMEGFVEYLKEKDSRLQSIMIKSTDSGKIYLPNNVSGATGRDTVYISNTDKHIDDLMEIVIENNK